MERTVRAHALLAAAIESWLDALPRRSADDLRRHGPQLQILEAVLTRSLERIGKEIAMATADDTAFSRCLALEVQLAVLERYWRFYRERLEQRDDPLRRRILDAADEVVWSCFTGLGGVDPTAVPLPFLEPTSTPIATPRSAVPLGLRTSDRLLADLISQLPLPLIALPVQTTATPWWLVLLAHEVGHHIQYDLEPNQALVGKTSDVLATAAGADADRWTEWRFELFADACSVVCLGATAIGAIAELEWGGLAAMYADRPSYPPTIVRLAVMCALATELDMSSPDLGVARWRPELANLPSKAALDRDLDLVPTIARALADLQVGGRALRSHVDKDAFGASGIPAMRQKLAGAAVGVRRARRTARLAVAASFDAYQQVPPPDPAALASATMDLIEATCDGSTRGAPDLHSVRDRCSALFDDKIASIQSDTGP